MTDVMILLYARWIQGLTIGDKQTSFMEVILYLIHLLSGSGYIILHLYLLVTLTEMDIGIL